MQPIAAIARRFDALGAKGKARWIAAMCAVLAIFTGFVLYVVLTHTFDRGNWGARLAALVLGLGVSIGVARAAEWLSETINTGEAELGKSLARAVPTAIILLIVFELCVSTFDEFAQATVGDFATVREIAARVAGQAEDKAAFEETDSKILSYFDSLRDRVRSGALNVVDERILRMMPHPYREQAFYGAMIFADTEVAPPGAPCVRDALAQSGLALALQPLGSPVNLPDPNQTRAREVEICRNDLGKIPDAERATDFIKGLNALLSLHNFYDEHTFGSDGPVLKLAAAQRTLCDGILKAAIAQGRQEATCVKVALATQQTGLLQRPKIMSIDREILARALPDVFTPAPIHWLDLFFLAAMWCTAAAALAIFLSDSVFEMVPGASVVSRWKTAAFNASLALIVAPLVTGAVLVALRLALYVWALMFDTASVAPTEIWPGFSVVFQLVPLAVSWLSVDGIWGVTIPGWIALPIVVGGLVVISNANSNSSDTMFSTLATFALFGILIGGIGPVLGGILMVMLLIVVTWLVPAFGLATLLPYLEPGVRVPRWWGTIGLCAAIVLAIWAAWRWWGILFQNESERLAPLILVATSFSLALTAIFILRDRPIRDLWPLVAVTVAFCLLGGAVGVQQATFYGVVREVAGVTAAPARETAQNSPSFQIPNALSYLYEGTADEPDVAPSEAQAKAEVREAAHLELALVGSLGFWLTIALLAAWSLRQREREHIEPARQNPAAVTQAS